MLSRDFRELIPNKYKKINHLKALLIKSGHKERTNSYLVHLCYILKVAMNIQTSQHSLIRFVSQNTLNTYGIKDPKILIDQCLYHLMPGFILRRTIVSGKTYHLPVPINEYRATFMAADWLRKAAFKDTKNALTVPYLLTREIGAAMKKTGSAMASLKAYIDMALDQRPFSRYIRKKRKIIARAKRGRASRLLYRRYKKTRLLRRRKKAKLRSIQIQQKRLRTHILKVRDWEANRNNMFNNRRNLKFKVKYNKRQRRRKHYTEVV